MSKNQSGGQMTKSYKPLNIVVESTQYVCDYKVLVIIPRHTDPVEYSKYPGSRFILVSYKTSSYLFLKFHHSCVGIWLVSKDTFICFNTSVEVYKEFEMPRVLGGPLKRLHVYD